MLELMKESGNIVAVDEDYKLYIKHVSQYILMDLKILIQGEPVLISVSFNISVNRRTSDHLSVYTVEMMAITTALQCIEETQIRFMFSIKIIEIIHISQTTGYS